MSIKENSCLCGSEPPTSGIAVKVLTDRTTKDSAVERIVCWLLASRPSNRLVYLRDGYAQTILRAATLRQKLQIELYTSPSHSILTPGRPVQALTLERQAPGRVATGVPILSHWYDSTEKSRRQRDSNPGSSALEADALTTRPTRRLCRKETTQDANGLCQDRYL